MVQNSSDSSIWAVGNKLETSWPMHRKLRALRKIQSERIKIDQTAAEERFEAAKQYLSSGWMDVSARI